MGSFKLKLVAYFSLIAVLPFAAAFSGLEAVTDRNETRRVDGALATGVRAALAALDDEIARAEAAATELARDPRFQEALATRDRRALRAAVRADRRLRVEAPGLRLGRTVRGPAIERSVAVVGRRGRVGRLIASVGIDDRLAGRVRRRAGLGASGQLAFVRDGRIVAATDRIRGRAALPTEPRQIDVGGRRFRALASTPLSEPEGMNVLILAPQSRIDKSSGWVQTRLFLVMAVALLLIALVAYLEGRSIVRTVGKVADAARGIARGRLGDRVAVRGRDEFASLGLAFNEMADQLQAHLRELEEERRRVREATLRFGEALAATHDIDQLLRVIVENAVEASGASRGELTQDGVALLESGEGRGPVKLQFPLSGGRETFGTLVLYGDGFTSEQRESAEWLVGHAITALTNARRHRTVEQQALVDGLTGLANRRLCTAALDKELARAKRFEEPLTVVLTDIDDFKRINDRWGHPTGDEVLKEFANTLRHSVREIDLAGRWGGEEFALLLPGTDLEGGRRLAERVRRALSKHSMTAPDGQPIMVTASFGVASFPDTEGQDELVAAADAALYEAKRAGKDRVVVAPPAAVRPTP